MNIAVISSDFKFSESGINRIIKAFPSVRIFESGIIPNNGVRAVIVDDSPGRELNRFPNLEIIFSISAGVDNLLDDSSLPDVPIIRVTSPDMISLMREYVTYQVIRLHRQFKEIEQQQINRNWVWMPPTKAANSCRVSILGLGQLGLATANALQAIGFQVFGWSNSHKTIKGIPCEFGMNGLEKLLLNTDILVCLLPLTNATKEILNENLFYKLPSGSSIINVSRGECLNESDLINAINSGQISSATLDVFKNEPLTTESSLWNYPQINITPHLAAYPLADSFIDSLIENLKYFINGEQLVKVVNRNSGY
jgi:glyoxylate/hydroxypyruvate reductase A